MQSLETIILDVIKLFLDLCHSPVIRSSGVSLIRRILQQQLRYIYRNLTAPRIMLQHSTLRLLISMNSFSASTTREMLDTFNFQLNVIYTFVKEHGHRHIFLYILTLFDCRDLQIFAITAVRKATTQIVGNMVSLTR